MNLEQQKERALAFLKNFEKADPKVFEDLITDDFEFEMMGRLPGVAPMRGKDALPEEHAKDVEGDIPQRLEHEVSFDDRRRPACRDTG